MTQDSPLLQDFVGQLCQVMTKDGRIYRGTVAGLDRVCNTTLSNCQELIYSGDAPIELLPLGLYIIRGDNIGLIGHAPQSFEVDMSVQAPPLPPILDSF